MQSILEQISSLLSGDLNYDRVAEAKQLINEFLDSRQIRRKKMQDLKTVTFDFERKPLTLM